MLTPHKWCRVTPPCWAETIRHPAVYVDEARCCCYVHGGQLTSNGFISYTLYEICWSDVSVDDVIGTRQMHRAELCSLRIRSLSASAAAQSTNQPVSSDGSSPNSLQSSGPALYGHMLLRHGDILVVHGGKDADGIVHHRMLAFHLTDRVWEDTSSWAVVGGCAAPRMFGHAAAPIPTAEGNFLVVGVACTPHGKPTPMSPLERKRGRSPAPRREAKLSVYSLDVDDLTNGWQRVDVMNPTAGPSARHFFSLSTFPKPWQSFSEESMDPCAFVVGGVTGSVEHVDVWRLTLSNGIWRQVDLNLAPPSMRLTSAAYCQKPVSSRRTGPFVPRIANQLLPLQRSEEGGADAGGVVPLPATVPIVSLTRRRVVGAAARVEDRISGREAVVFSIDPFSLDTVEDGGNVQMGSGHGSVEEYPLSSPADAQSLALLTVTYQRVRVNPSTTDASQLTNLTWLARLHPNGSLTIHELC